MCNVLAVNHVAVEGHAIAAPAGIMRWGGSKRASFVGVSVWCLDCESWPRSHHATPPQRACLDRDRDNRSKYYLASFRVRQR